MAGPTRWLYGGGLVAAALLGSAFALSGAAIFGGFDKGSTTVSVQTPVAAGPISVKRAGTAMTVNQIYRRAAPGVVQVTATQVETAPSVDPFGLPLPSQQQSEALGSGFVIDK